MFGFVQSISYSLSLNQWLDTKIWLSVFHWTVSGQLHSFSKSSVRKLWRGPRDRSMLTRYLPSSPWQVAVAGVSAGNNGLFLAFPALSSNFYASLSFGTNEKCLMMNRDKWWTVVIIGKFNGDNVFLRCIPYSKVCTSGALSPARLHGSKLWLH